MKVVAFEVENWEAEAFHNLGIGFEVKSTEQPLRTDLVDQYADAEIISTFINGQLDNEVLKQFNQLKLIATRSTGFDHIDLQYCNEHDIAVCNVPSYGSHTVAEHVFGLLLTLSHRLEQAIDRTRKGDFSPRGLQGFDLKGRTLGVVGTGDIGLNAIRIAKGFGMDVLAFDVVEKEEAAAELGFRYCSLNELLSHCDVITLHVPANEKTHHMISDSQFSKMKHGSVLINTSRGEVVDIHAMLRALADGRLAAAGLDVLPEEPVIREEAELLRSVYEQKHNLDTLLANHLLTHMRNVVVTPHSAFNTVEAVHRILNTTIENIVSFSRGENVNHVNKTHQHA